MIHLFDSPHWHHGLHAPNTELGELYTSLALRFFAYSLVNLFVPIYLFQLGFSFQWVIGYFVMVYLARIPLDLWAGKLIARFGVKHTMVFGYVLLAVFLLALIGLEHWTQAWLLILASGLAAGDMSLSFVAYHVDFSKVKDKDSTGQEVGFFYVLVAISAALGPLAGGLLAHYFGLEVVLAASIGLLLAALGVLFRTGEPLAKHTVDYSWQDFRHNFAGGLRWGAANADHLVANSFWPFFLFFTVFQSSEYLGVGAVISAALLLSIISDYLIGKTSDGIWRNYFIRLGALGSGMLHILRQFATNALKVIGLNIATEIASAAFRIPLNRQLYLEADQPKRVEFIVFNEVTSEIVKVVLSCVILVASLWLMPATALVVGFLATAAIVSPVALTTNAKL